MVCVRSLAGLVLHHCQFFAARDDFGGARVRRTKENSPARQRWEGVKDTGSPGTGRKSFYSGASFAPFRGWSIGYGNPRLTPWAMLFRPPGLVLWLRLCRSAGQPILAAAGFQPATGVSTLLRLRQNQLVAPTALPPVSYARLSGGAMWDRPPGLSTAGFQPAIRRHSLAALAHRIISPRRCIP